MNQTPEKIVAYVDGEPIPQPTECYGVPGEDSIIDCINPRTGLTAICRETFEQIRERYPNAERMTIESHCKAKAQRQDTPITWSDTTEAKYWEMLEVLPPAMMRAGYFLVGEPWDHHAITGEPRFSCYGEPVSGHFVVASRPITRRELKGMLQ